MSLTLHADHLQSIQTHAERTYPEECCGLLVGTFAADARVVHDVYETQNAWDQNATANLSDRAFTKSRRYWIAPEAMLACMREARRLNLEIIGIYHSHPDSEAVPSECDRALAWLQYSYLIVAVEQGSATDYRSWTLNEQHLFEPEHISESEQIAIAASARM